MMAREPNTGTVPLFSDRILACLRPPGGGAEDILEPGDDCLRNPRTGETFPFVSGIPSLFVGGPESGTVVTQKVKSFYEENPFPNYEGLEEFGELVSKGSSNPFSANLLRSIGYNKTILECGCGTGQLSHFLQLNNNHVLGVDMSLASLNLALEHKRRNALTRSSFAQMNIFDLAIKDGSFDVVISHGVLHHTFDPERAFAEIVRKAKPGGMVVVGLYNSYARVMTWVRSKLIGLLGPNIDYVVRTKIRDATKSRTWIADQYYNPHESWHSIDDVLGWFDRYGLEFVNCAPGIMGTEGEEPASLFTRTSPGNRYERIVTQLSWLGTIAREGSLFDVVGRKRA